MPKIKDQFPALLNWSEISRHVTGKSRQVIQSGKPIRKKHIPALDRLFLVDLPNWWRQRRGDVGDEITEE